MQTEIRIFHQQAELIDIPAHLVAQCRTWRDAVRLVMNQSRTKRSQQNWAESLGFSNGYLSQVLNGTGSNPKALNPDQIHEIQTLAGNRGFQQWTDMKLRGELAHQSIAARRQLLMAELQELDAAGVA